MDVVLLAMLGSFSHVMVHSISIYLHISRLFWKLAKSIFKPWQMNIMIVGKIQCDLLFGELFTVKKIPKKGVLAINGVRKSILLTWNSLNGCATG